MSRKALTITLEVKELMFDIMNKAHLTGRARQGESKGYERSSDIQVAEGEEGEYQIRRSLSDTFAQLKTMFDEYLDEEHEMADDLVRAAIDNDGQLTLKFRLPSNYNSATAEALSSSIHTYMVDMALSQWYEITNKEDVEDIASRASASIAVARRALYRRSRPTRPDKD
jgi:hypothetical protein